VEKLNAQGVNCDTPQVNHRVKSDLGASCAALSSEGRKSGDPELARACDVLTAYLLREREGVNYGELGMAASELIAPVKDFLAMDEGGRVGALEGFCREMTERIGALEACLTEKE